MRTRSARSRSRRRPRSRPERGLSRQHEVFREQARSCAGRSPLYEDLCTRLADEPGVAKIAREPEWDTPLRLLGGVHYLVLSGGAPGAFRDWGAFRRTLEEHADFLRRFVAEQDVQTNEVQRSWVLLPAFLLLVQEAGADRVDLVELGPSAGLNLVWDRYRYVYARGRWGSEDAPLELSGAERSPVPAAVVGAHVSVGRRVGVDLNPVDVTTDEGALLLKSFVWADQTERLRRLERAIDSLRGAPPDLIRGDYVSELPRLLAVRRGDALTIVFQTASLGYVGEHERRRVYDALGAAAREAPLGWVSATNPVHREVSGWGLDVRLLPSDRRVVAHADFHGSWLDWLA